MKMTRCAAISAAIQCSLMLAGILLLNAGPLTAETPGAPDGARQSGRDPSRPAPVCEPSLMDSPYIPVDSWVYSAVLRLYSLGFLDNVYLGMRPWTRASVGHMLEQAGAKIDDADAGPAADEAQGIYQALDEELTLDMQGPCRVYQGKTRVESVYSVTRAMT